MGRRAKDAAAEMSTLPEEICGYEHDTTLPQ
jgi:hypothetical protein